MDESPDIPQPAGGARWRWATARGALVGGGVLAAILSVGSAAGASSTGHGSPPPSTAHGKPPAGMAHPTTGGRITALSTDTITIETRTKKSQTVSYAATTTFRSMKGTSSASALAVGDFVTVIGTQNSDGSVTATSIMLGRPPAGRPGAGSRPPKGAPG